MISCWLASSRGLTTIKAVSGKAVLGMCPKQRRVPLQVHAQVSKDVFDKTLGIEIDRSRIALNSDADAKRFRCHEL